MVRQMYVSGDDTSNDDTSDYRLVASAEDGFAFGKPHAVAEVRPVSRKELKTAAELAAMIELDLAQHPDCPKNGFRVSHRIRGDPLARDVDDHHGCRPSSKPPAVARLDRRIRGSTSAAIRVGLDL